MTSYIQLLPSDIKQLIINLFSLKNLLDNWPIFEEFLYNETIDTIFTRYPYSDLKYLALDDIVYPENTVGADKYRYFEDSFLYIEDPIQPRLEEKKSFRKLTNEKIEHYIGIMKPILNKHVIPAYKIKHCKNLHEIKVIVELESVLSLRNENLNPIQILFKCTSNSKFKPGIINNKNSIKRINLGSKYKKPLEENSLPLSLTHLDFDWDCPFQSKLKAGVLPPKLMEFELPHHYNHPLEPGDLPNSIQYLTFNDFYSHFLTSETLPKDLRYLKMGYDCKPLIKGSYPQHLTILDLERVRWKIEPNILPNSLKKLILGHYDHQFEIGSLPENLKDLKIGFYRFDFEAGILPHGLEKLYTELYRSINNCVFPSSLKVLQLGYNFSFGPYDHPFPTGVLPEGLIKAKLYYNFKYSFQPGTFPSTLNKLCLTEIGNIEVD